MSNPNFDPVYSTWNIWRAGEQTQCLDDDLTNIENDISSLESSMENKANVSHTHTGYVTQSSFDALESIVDDKANAIHTHSEYAPLFTGDNGDVKIIIYTSSNKNLLNEINSLASGVYTIYSQTGVTGNPKTTEAWRLFVHKSTVSNGWIIAFGTSGSVYANYLSGANNFKGWKCIYDATNSVVLWSGAYYMSSPNDTPQVVTPSKKLSECRTGWLLLWSDYNTNTSTATDADFCTTYIPKYNPSGSTWSGKVFYCDIPMFVGSDATDLSTERRCIKALNVYNNRIEGSSQNNQGGRNDVVLRAVYEV